MKPHNSRRLYAWIAIAATIAMCFTACSQAHPASTAPTPTSTVAAAVTTTTFTATVTTTTVITTTTTTTTSTTTTTTTLPPTTVPTTVSTAPPTTTTTEPPTTTTTTSPTHIAVPPQLSDGVTPSLWTPNCHDYITLRPAPYSWEAITTIPAGDTMVLLEWSGKYAKVSYYGLVGYVMAYWIAPADGIDAALSTVALTNWYTYEQMCADIDTLCAQFPSSCTRGSIGTSELGRDIPVLKLGADSASHHVLIQGAIHGLEHMTAWVMMASADNLLTRGALPEDVCFHLIPMSNPDGVVTAQTGLSTDRQRGVYASDVAAGYTNLDEASYAMQWKANGFGVDLNRNFDAGWELINGRPKTSSQQYKGEAVFSARETRALRDYTLSRTFDATISYHAMGSLIYYEYGSAQPVNSLSYELGCAVRAVTGYPLVGSESVDAGGYKDWAMNALGIPSLTIEIGCEDTPLVYQEINNVLYRNLPVMEAVAQWVKQ